MNALLIDTNLLLLYLIGNADPQMVGFKPVETYDLDDLAVVTRIAGRHKRHVSLPNILSEASNLIKQSALPDPGTLIAGYVARLAEIFVPSANAIRQADYARLGLTDAAILRLADQSLTVLTTDNDLWGRLVANEIDAVNILHAKTPRR